MSTLWRAPRGGEGWKSWIMGTALPLCVWIMFLGVICVSMVVDGQRMVHEGASVELLLAGSATTTR